MKVWQEIPPIFCLEYGDHHHHHHHHYQWNSHYSVAKLPYNHVRDICFYALAVYLRKVLFPGFKDGVKRTVWKRNGSWFLIRKRESDWQWGLFFPSYGSIKKEQQECHWHRLVAISSRVFSHACSGSFGPQPGKRQEPTVANLFVDSFIPRCHVITWPPRDRFQPNFGSANKNLFRKPRTIHPYYMS